MSLMTREAATPALHLHISALPFVHIVANFIFTYNSQPPLFHTTASFYGSLLHTNLTPSDIITTMAAPQIHTYHCACTSLLLATTTPLPSLPRRATSLDHSTILPLHSDAHPPSSLTPHTTLLSMTPDRRTTTIRREDGFEKRILWRCGRCRVVVGYELDPSHFEAPTTAGGGEVQGESSVPREDGGVPRVLYILPGWVQSTEHMASGKKISEQGAVLESAQLGVTVWE
ncbi:hypothetical protein GMDG_03799 [Pseudogymnoascus destructans 20631-21]|uniref:STEEP1 domain-containing protein n=1 Tax=Pseudogymnoascus destructans (strain ATCC MYA-4855 / 20631-21) TaxID=658429 RepID=L8GB27_PSED2|nr:hypothetical protein GMDG_03799 [Pseudogymnoascus destructans 20631-21]